MTRQTNIQALEALGRISLGKKTKLTKRQKRTLDAYAARSEDHRRTVEQIGNPEWVREQLERMNRPTPRVEMKAFIWAQCFPEIEKPG